VYCDTDHLRQQVHDGLAEGHPITLRVLGGKWKAGGWLTNAVASRLPRSRVRKEGMADAGAGTGAGVLRIAYLLGHFANPSAKYADFGRRNGSW
jgi:hypothetical protein